MAYRALPTNDDMPSIFHEWLHWLPLYEDKPDHTVRAYGQGVRRVVSFTGLSPADFGPGSLDQASLTDTEIGIAPRRARVQNTDVAGSL